MAIKGNSKIEIIDIHGRKLIYDQLENRQSFAFGISLPVGSAAEYKSFPHGTAHFMEHMLFKGYPGTGQLKLTRLMERLGIESNAYTTKDHTHYYIRGLAQNFRKALNPFLRSIFDPTLFEKDIQKEKAIITEEIKSYEDDIEETAFEEAEKSVFANTAYAHSITGDKDSVESIDRDTLQLFHKKYYREGDLVFSYSGPSRMVKVIESSLSSILGSKVNTLNSQISTQKLSIPHGTYEKKVNSPNNHLVWMYPIGELDIRDRIILSIYNYIVGEGNSSRLFWDLRERKGLSYHNYSGVNSYGKFLTFYLYLSYSPENQKKISKSLEKLMFDGFKVKSQELEIAKNQISTQLVIESEDTMYRMQANAKDILTYNRVIGIEEVLDIVNTIQKSEIEHISSLISPKVLNQLLLRSSQ